MSDGEDKSNGTSAANGATVAKAAPEPAVLAVTEDSKDTTAEAAVVEESVAKNAPMALSKDDDNNNINDKDVSMAEDEAAAPGDGSITKDDNVADKSELPGRATPEQDTGSTSNTGGAGAVAVDTTTTVDEGTTSSSSGRRSSRRSGGARNYSEVRLAFVYLEISNRKNGYGTVPKCNAMRAPSLNESLFVFLLFFLISLHFYNGCLVFQCCGAWCLYT
jgi:hypothetical protein